MAGEEDISIYIRAIISGFDTATAGLLQFRQELGQFQSAATTLVNAQSNATAANQAYDAAIVALTVDQTAATSSMLGLADLDNLGSQRVRDLTQAQTEAIAVQEQLNAAKLAAQTNAMQVTNDIETQKIRELTKAQDDAIATNNLYNASLQAMKEAQFSLSSGMLGQADLQSLLAQRTQDLTRVQDENTRSTVQAKSAWIELAAQYYIVKQAIDVVIGGIQQLYETAAQGAQFERLQTSGAALAQTFGVDLPKAVAQLKAASLDTISSQTAMIDVNKALLIGAVTNVNDLSNLMLVAANNGRAIGLSASDAFDQVIRGVSGLSTRLLGFAGIVVSDTKAYADYAASIGTTAAALDGQQKRQALVNAILQTYLPLVKQAGGLTDDNAAAYERFAADATDLANQLKALLADALTPVIKALDTEFFFFTKIHDIIIQHNQDMAASSGSVQEYTDKVTGSQQSLRDALGPTVVGIAQTANTLFEMLIPGYKAAYQAADPLANATEKLAQAHMLLGTAMSDAIQSHKDWIAQQDILADAVDKSTASIQKMLDTSDKLSFSDLAKKAYDFAVSVNGVTAGTDALGISLGLTDPAFLKARDNLIELEKQSKEAGNTLGITADAIRKAFAPVGFEQLLTLHEKFTVDSNDAQNKLNDQLDILKSDFNNQKAKDSLDLGRKLTDIDTDQARRMQDLAIQTQQKEEALADSHNKKLQNIEIEHQRQIQQIMQRYDLSRLNALIDLNGKALFQANAQRDADLANAANTAKQKAQDENANYAQALKDLQDAQQQQKDAIQRDEDRKREDAKKEFDRRRADAQTAYDEKYADDESNFRKTQTQIETAYDTQRNAILTQLGLMQTDNRKALTDRTKDFLDFVAANETILQALISGSMTIDQVRKQFWEKGINWGGVPFEPPTDHNCPDGCHWNAARGYCVSNQDNESPCAGGVGSPSRAGVSTPAGSIPTHNVKVTLNVVGSGAIAALIRESAMNAIVDVIRE